MVKSPGAENGAPATQAGHPHPTLARESSSSSMRRQELAQPTMQTAQPSQPASAATSASTSPFASRETSPARPSIRSRSTMRVTAARRTSTPSPAPVSTKSTQQQQQQQPTSAAVSPTASRRNNPHDTSPTRTRSSIPTASQKTAVLSAETTPTLLPAASDASSMAQAPGPQKSEQSRSNPRWPVSPRLRSPPAVLNRPHLPPPSGSSDALSANSLRAAAPSPSLEALPAPSDSEAEDLYLQPGMRTPVRGVSGNVPTLETVQEASPLVSSQAVDAAALEKLETASVVSDAGGTAPPEVAEASPAKAIRTRQLSTQNYDSGSETGSTKASRRTAATSSGSAPPPLTSRQSSSAKASGKGKPGEGSQPTMTVETETVTSIPNVVLGPNAGQGSNGSLRKKPSSETIRPKKEKKKSRKQTAVAAGTATSKADIFEAKVASAVDEANTSDSEETFVYDSNPADSRDRPHRFHHSRTPSATSVANDRNGMRSIHSILEGAGPSATVKKNMKFVNTFGNSSGNDSGMGDEEAKAATVRGVAPGSGRGTARLHHHVGTSGGHIGRWGLSGPKSGHPSILDGESPFPATSSSARPKATLGGSNGASSFAARQAGGASSPRPSGSVSSRGAGSGPFSQKRSLGSGASLGYDMDDATPGQADDERTPLIAGSIRSSGRGNRTRRHHMTLRSLEQQSYHRPPASFLNRFASCLVLTVMLMLVLSGAIGFMFATSQPLEDIELVKISGVIASEQELMFDLFVRAHNPNVVVVTVDSADMEVFAKSPYAGNDSEWWRRPHSGDADGVDLDALDNEPRDQPTSSPNFLLGKFTTFDNPLSFEGSFFHHGLSTSRSGVRIRRPGNGTDGGSERWERILQDEFDLIIKGVLRYSLPLSQRVRSALIEGRTTVKPNAADDPSHTPNGTATISASG